MSGVILSVVTPSARLHEGCNPDSTHSSVNTPWSIVVALRSYISVQGKWLVSNCPLLVGFTGLLEGDIWVGGGGGGVEPPGSYASVCSRAEAIQLCWGSI